MPRTLGFSWTRTCMPGGANPSHATFRSLLGNLGKRRRPKPKLDRQKKAMHNHQTRLQTKRLHTTTLPAMTPVAPTAMHNHRTHLQTKRKPNSIAIDHTQSANLLQQTPTVDYHMPLPINLWSRANNAPEVSLDTTSGAPLDPILEKK